MMTHASPLISRNVSRRPDAFDFVRREGLLDGGKDAELPDSRTAEWFVEWDAALGSRIAQVGSFAFSLLATEHDV